MIIVNDDLRILEKEEEENEETTTCTTIKPFLQVYHSRITKRAWNEAKRKSSLILLVHEDELSSSNFEAAIVSPLHDRALNARLLPKREISRVLAHLLRDARQDFIRNRGMLPNDPPSPAGNNVCRYPLRRRKFPASQQEFIEAACLCVSWMMILGHLAAICIWKEVKGDGMDRKQLVVAPVVFCCEFFEIIG